MCVTNSYPHTKLQVDRHTDISIDESCHTSVVCLWVGVLFLCWQEQSRKIVLTDTQYYKQYIICCTTYVVLWVGVLFAYVVLIVCSIVCLWEQSFEIRSAISREMWLKCIVYIYVCTCVCVEVRECVCVRLNLLLCARDTETQRHRCTQTHIHCHTRTKTHSHNHTHTLILSLSHTYTNRTVYNSIVRLSCVLQCVAVCCSVLQCVAVSCSVPYSIQLNSETFIIISKVH